jgi:hypothetical protein
MSRITPTHTHTPHTRTHTPLLCDEITVLMYVCMHQYAFVPIFILLPSCELIFVMILTGTYKL